MAPSRSSRTTQVPASRRVQGFPPLAAASARVLVVGSMPGEASLRAGQYYAHPQNAFWPVMAGLCGADPALPYAERVQRLVAAGLAVWDVLQHCVRTGSLDAAIDKDGRVANDFASFLRAHPQVRAVFCNGTTAFTCWRRYVAPQLEAEQLHAGQRAIPVAVLPSTSPAHASLRPHEKAAQWHAAVSPFLRT